MEVTVSPDSTCDGVTWNWSTSGSGTFTVVVCQADQAEETEAPVLVARARHRMCHPSVSFPAGTTAGASLPEVTVAELPV
ncbi:MULTISPECIES: hypothetical protein, partial [unclassified Microbispora]|uniref:hypothetical protein n=1 Tax=unclassified Microbispora TaxID=2614687 RepID=UPI00197C928D